MSKPRATTIQQRFGFKDNDLTTPLHDEILLWLDENIEEVIKDLIRWNPEWEPSEIEAAQRRMLAYIEEQSSCCYSRDLKLEWENCIPPIPPKSELEIHTTWEHPIVTSSKNKYIVGFIDLKADCDIPVRPITPSVVTYDAPSCPRWYISTIERTYYFEIKTTINSLGEVIRQIRMYKEYAHGFFVIVCPDDRFKEAIESQNITFVKYEPMRWRQGELWRR